MTVWPCWNPERGSESGSSASAGTSVAASSGNVLFNSFVVLEKGVHTVEDNHIRWANVGNDLFESRFDALRSGNIDGEGVESIWHIVAFGTRPNGNFVVLLDESLCYGATDVGASAYDESNVFGRHLRTGVVRWG